jgi:hypothetical protein
MDIWDFVCEERRHLTCKVHLRHRVPSSIEAEILLKATYPAKTLRKFFWVFFTHSWVTKVNYYFRCTLTAQ